ncbi:hypothetical protein [Pseudomonas sp. 2835]|uniref:hypothetical protein n=1 Tax=Pseudomonas sp. 2835 TaxID=3156451 RepID=UPI003D1E2283
MESFKDGVQGEKLTSEEFKLWENELSRMNALRNLIGELDPLFFNELETRPSPIPRGLLHQILTTYEENAKSKVNVFITGSAPNFSMNFNWGTLTYSFPLAPGEMRQTHQAFVKMSEKTQQCIDEKKDWDKTKEALWQTAATVAGTAKVTQDIIKCGLVLGAAAEVPAFILLLENACADIVSDLADMLDAVAAEKAARDAMERERYHRDVEDRIRRSMECADIEGGIMKARDLDKQIRESKIG